MSVTTLICLLDKTYPPHHAFVTGFLAKSLPQHEDVTVYLIVGRISKEQRRVLRYFSAVCFCVLPRTPRSFIKKFMSLFVALGLTFHLVKRARQRGHRVAVMVRNDPFLLIAASFLRGFVDHLVFQNSFPLEETHSSSLKRAIHRALYRLGGRNTDGLLCVSPLGLLRAARFVPAQAKRMFVPLLPDFDGHSRKQVINDLVRFLYIGTHDPSRELSTVVAAAVRCLYEGASAKFTFVGGKPGEITELERMDGIDRLQKIGLIEFIPQVSRTMVPHFLANSDVGISAVPVTAINREMSPTKLAEYMGAGLAVVASKGVPLQDQMLEESGGGLSCQFTIDELCKAFHAISVDRHKLHKIQQRALAYSQQRLSISNYTEALAAFLTGSST